MTNAPHANGNANENLTLHFKVKDFNEWRTSYKWKREGPGLCRYHQREGIPRRRRPE
jgi:hypothetical protein